MARGSKETQGFLLTSKLDQICNPHDWQNRSVISSYYLNYGRRASCILHQRQEWYGFQYLNAIVRQMLSQVGKIQEQELCREVLPLLWKEYGDYVREAALFKLLQTFESYSSLTEIG
jgi:hypothetical protein